MDATIPDGAVTPAVKQLIVLKIPTDIVKRIQTTIQQTGITRQAFILLAIHEKLKRDSQN